MQIKLSLSSASRLLTGPLVAGCRSVQSCDDDATGHDGDDDDDDDGDDWVLMMMRMVTMMVMPIEITLTWL